MGLNGSNIEFAKTINIDMVSRFKLSGVERGLRMVMIDRFRVGLTVIIRMGC